VGQIEAFWLHRSPTAADKGSTQKREVRGSVGNSNSRRRTAFKRIAHNANGRFLQSRSVKLTNHRWEVDHFELFALDHPKGAG